MCKMVGRVICGTKVRMRQAKGGGEGDVVLPTGAWSRPLGCGPAH